MNDLISRQAAIAYAISGRVRTLPTSEDGENWIRTEDVRQSLSTMPSAQPERKKGKWIWHTSDIWECSECGRRTHVDECMEKPMYEWCPYCGAEMKGEQE